MSEYVRSVLDALAELPDDGVPCANCGLIVKSHTVDEACFCAINLSVPWAIRGQRWDSADA